MKVKILARPGVIKKGRAIKGLSQGDLAEKLNIKRPYLSLVENGKASLSERLSKRICKTLQMDFNEVFYFEEEKNS